MRVAIFLLILLVGAFGQRIEFSKWEKAQSFLQYLQNSGLPKSLYYSLDPEEKELVSEIYAGVPYYTLYDANATIDQVLIPINEELQIHIYKKDRGYGIDLEPIIYREREERFYTILEGIPYNTILRLTENLRLAHEFVSAFRGSFDFSRIHKGDKLAIIYDQKYRLGRLFGMPQIKVAMIESGGKRHYVFGYKGKYYDENGKELQSFLLKRPIPGARITSRFTLRRWHPVLHRWRAHLGVDFGARRGTPVRAAGDGRVVFAGRKGGYGKVVIIAHRGGYKTLYAHLSRIRKGIRRGRSVKQGQVIGYVGSTGLSTGPHLHFGLYKNNRPINPLRVVRIAKSRLSGKELRQFKAKVKAYKAMVEELVKEDKPVARKVPESIELVSYLGGEHGERAHN